jgi:hypothetical protein
MARVSIFLIIVALIGSILGCAPAPTSQYDLTISSTGGGSVTNPGESGPYTYDEGEVVSLVAQAEEGYEFVNWTGDVDEIANVEDDTTTITMKDDYSIMAKFAVKQYGLTTTSTEGGSVTTPEEGIFTYNEGTVIDLVAEAEEGYRFVSWTGDVSTISDANTASTTITINGDYIITATFAKVIRDWHDLNAIRDNLGGSFVLMNDLDLSCLGYEELASKTANDGAGWQPIAAEEDPFIGTFDGQEFHVKNLFINRPDEVGVGLFGYVGRYDAKLGVIKNVGLADGIVTGTAGVGGIVGHNWGTVDNCSFVGTVTGIEGTGGLVGHNWRVVSNCYFYGRVFGYGGLVGINHGVVSNSHYNCDEVLINELKAITIGALYAEDFNQWLSNDKSLDVNARLSQESSYCLISNVSDFKELLAFGQDDSLKFRMKDDLNLATEPNFYIPYLAGEFDGDGHTISNLSFTFVASQQLGLFGYLSSSAKVSNVRIENITLVGDNAVGALAAVNEGTIGNCYSSGSVFGEEYAGGLVGYNWHGTVSNSFSTADVTGQYCVGGLVGYSCGKVTNSYSTGKVTGYTGYSQSIIGGLVGYNSYGGTVSDSYSIGRATGSGDVGGLVGQSYQGTVSNSFWDTETSGQITSAGGSGKTTAEMKSIATFLSAGWNIIAVTTPDIRNPSYIWNIVDGETYPFLSWQPIS